MYCLIVDDDSYNLDICGKMVEKLGFAVRTAESANEALSYCGKVLPDVVLLDWRMPERDGIDFIHSLKKIPGSEKVKIVMCTAEGQRNRVKEALNNGVQGYVIKPFDGSQIEKQFQNLELM